MTSYKPWPESNHLRNRLVENGGDQSSPCMYKVVGDEVDRQLCFAILSHGRHGGEIRSLSNHDLELSQSRLWSQLFVGLRVASERRSWPAHFSLTPTDSYHMTCQEAA